MHRNHSAIAATVLALILSVTFSIGCLAADKDFTIKVTTSPGLSWSGSYMVVGASGQSTSQTIDRVDSWQTTVKGIIVSVCFQKGDAAGSLRVEILREGQVLSQSTTSAEYGVVTVATGD